MNNCPIRRLLSRRAFNCGIIVFTPELIQHKPSNGEESGNAATAKKSHEAKLTTQTPTLFIWAH